MKGQTMTSEQLFEQFWAIYPRKIAKKFARKSWERMSAAERQSALDAIPNHVRAWRGKDTKYIPHPASWLNAGRWDDELERPRLSGPDVWLDSQNFGPVIEGHISEVH